MYNKNDKEDRLMIQQDNIKDFAKAAFRFQGHLTANTKIDTDELAVVLAVSSTIHHLQIEDDAIAVEGVKRVYYTLPLGNIKRGLISSRVRYVAAELNVDESVLWRRLRRARYIFNCYYKKFTLQNRQ